MVRVACPKHATGPVARLERKGGNRNGPPLACSRSDRNLTFNRQPGIDDMLEDEIRELEAQLVTPAVRASADALDRLVSDQFFEFGSSGRVYTKPDVIAQMMAAPNVSV